MKQWTVRVDVLTRYAMAAMAGIWAIGAVHGQNLVPNGSFEQYVECPDFLNQMYRATGWSRYRGSPDYFNRCDVEDSIGIPSEAMGIPLNAFGWQEPATGDGYAGCYLWWDTPNSREHLGTRLSDPLLPGFPVYVSFKVSPATGGPLENMRWTSEGAGVRFSVEPYLISDQSSPLQNDAALSMTYAPIDTSAWYQVEGMYVPDSSYEYVILGNFYADTLMAPILLNPSGDFPAAYVYIDDVCVSYTAADCGVDVGSQEQHSSERMRVYPVPFVDQFTVEFGGNVVGAAVLQLFEPTGRSVWEEALAHGQRSIKIVVPDLAAGIYVLHVETPVESSSSIVLKTR